MAKSKKQKIVLPKPKHEHGYTMDEILDFCLTYDEFQKLLEWFGGQTVTMNEKHEIIYYTSDVIRGLELFRYNIPTYFD